MNGVMIDLETLLQKFVRPEDPIMKHVLVIRHYRGDGTASGDRRLRVLVGDERYKDIHVDTMACTGGIAVFVPRFRAARAVDAPVGWRLLSAEHYWAMSEIDEHSPEVTAARPETVARVVAQTRSRLDALPGLEYVEVKRVHFWESGRTTMRKIKPAPQDVVYFRFEHGYGVIAAKPEPVEGRNGG